MVFKRETKARHRLDVSIKLRDKDSRHSLGLLYFCAS
jgi:hypothetical protein